MKGNNMKSTTSAMDNRISKEIREKLAEIEHERWADWQLWCHDVLRQEVPDNIMRDWVEPILGRWEKQARTPYSKLSDKEKASDMEQVDRYWPLIEQLLIKARLDELDKLNGEMRKHTWGHHDPFSLIANCTQELTKQLGEE